MILSLKEEKGRIRKSDYLKYPTVPKPQFVIQWHLRGKGIDDLTEEEKKALEKAHFKEIMNPKGLVRSAIEKCAGCSNHQDFRVQLTEKTCIGWSVAFDMPILIRDENGEVDLVPIYDLCRLEGAPKDTLIIKPSRRLEVWSKDGWSPIKWVAVHGDDKSRLRLTATRGGVIETTIDHSLLDPSGQPKKVSELKVGERILLCDLPTLPEIYDVNEDLAWLLGYFVADGYAGFHTKRGYRMWTIEFSEPDPQVVKEVCKRLNRLGFKAKVRWHPEAHVYIIIPSPRVPFAEYVYDLCYYKFRRPRLKVKRVPQIILNASRRSKLAFLKGYLTGDGCFREGRWQLQGANILELQGILLIAHSLGLNYWLNVVWNKRAQAHLYSLCLYSGSALKPRDQVVKILRRERSRKREVHGRILVYDIETESHTFLAGLGRILAHNTIVGLRWGIVGKDITKDDLGLHAETTRKRGFRAEMKATQPCPAWLNVKGYVPKGKVGATRHHGGFFIIMAKGDVVYGALKPYFKEYFVKDPYCFKDWTRIIVRGVKAQKLDPEKKTPLKGQYELIWRIMIPETQKPYAITERAKRKGWFPPKGVIPFPLEWAKKHWKEDVEKWLEWVQEKWKEKPKGQMKLSKKIKWALFMHTWMGQVVIRGIPNYEFYLRIDDGKQKILSFVFERNPLRYTSISGIYEGRVAKKWLTFEGDLPPKSPYNPTKKLTVHVIKLDGGDGEIDLEETEEGAKILKLKLNGKILSGNFLLVQEEKGSDIFVFKRERRLAKGYFKLYKVKAPKNEFMELLIDAFPNKPYLRVVLGAPELKSGSVCIVEWTRDRSLFEREGEVVVGGRPFKFTVYDEGEVDTAEVSDYFISFTLVGSKVNKAYALTKINALWKLEEYTGAQVELQEDPLEGMQYKKFKVEEFPRKGYNIMWIYDPRFFGRAEPNWQDYLPDLELPEGIIDILLGVYPVIGTIHHVRCMGVQYDPEKISDDEVEKFIKKNKLDKFVSPLIRRKREIEI